MKLLDVRVISLFMSPCFWMLRRDKYEPEIKLYYVEKHMSAEEEDEQEEKLLDRFNFEGDANQMPDPACDALASDNEHIEDDDGISDEHETGSPSSAGTRGKPSQGLQRQHALEASACYSLSLSVLFALY